jgi:hypothetical protein
MSLPAAAVTRRLDPEFLSYCGYWFWCRPSRDALRGDLREVLGPTRPDRPSRHLTAQPVATAHQVRLQREEPHGTHPLHRPRPG